jgi:hypothetical protein
MAVPSENPSAPAAVNEPTGLYVTGEDHLRISSFGSVAGAVVALEGRFVKPDGTVIPIVDRHVPASDRTLVTSFVTLGEGWLTHVQVRASTGTVATGQVYVIVEVVRGRIGAVQALATLVEGYATSTRRLAWPAAALGTSLDGAGALRSIAGTNPAAFTECSDAVPAGARWRLISWFAELITDATVANRQVTLFLDDGATTLYRITASGNQAAGLTRQYSAFVSSAAASLSGTVFLLPLPMGFVLGPGSRIRTVTATMQLGDNWGAPQILVEEWIDA